MPAATGATAESGPWSAEFRDVGPLSGAIVEPDTALPYRLVFVGDERAAAAANAYLRDLADTFARPLTMRSYGYDILR
jgi:hypothetical protein